MTRVTAPISKLTRGLASHPSASRPAYLAGTASHQTHAAALAGAGRAELGEWEDNNRRFTMTHRPTPSPVPSRNRVVPLMQTFNFRTTAPTAARLDTSTMDCAVMPSMADKPAANDAPLRVPLLPDNFAPARQNLTPEEPDGPLASPQIVIVAARPDAVVPASALTEVEGMGVDGVELKFAHAPAAGSGAGTSSSSSSSPPSEGMIRDLWKGLLDDIAPPAASPKTH